MLNQAMKNIVPYFFLFIILSGSRKPNHPANDESSLRIDSSVQQISLVVLGNVQDGGSPQIGCTK